MTPEELAAIKNLGTAMLRFREALTGPAPVLETFARTEAQETPAGQGEVAGAPETGLPAPGAPESPLSNGGAQPTTNPCECGDKVMERLALIILNAHLNLQVPGESWARKAAQAVLTELSNIFGELPTDAELLQWFVDGAAHPTASEDRRGLRQIGAMLRSHLAPILAAKDARIAELEALYAAAKVDDPERTETIDIQRKRIVFLESKIKKFESRQPANECTNAERTQYEATIELQKTRIAQLTNQRNEAQGLSSVRAIRVDTLKKELSECEKERRECLDKLSEANLVPPGLPLAEAINELLRQYNVGMTRVNEQKKRIAQLEEGLAASTRVSVNFCQEQDEARRKAFELEKRLAEATTPIDANGKTPGDVLREALREGPQSWDKAAAAVLRAFGPTTPTLVDGKTPGEVAREGYRKPIGQDIKSFERIEARYKNAAQAVLRAFGPPLARKALERVRGQVKELSNSTDDRAINVAVDIVQDSVLDFIDSEIARLGQSEKPANGHVHEISSCSHSDKSDATRPDYGCGDSEEYL